jgi:outer membrane protein
MRSAGVLEGFANRAGFKKWRTEADYTEGDSLQLACKPWNNSTMPWRAVFGCCCAVWCLMPLARASAQESTVVEPKSGAVLLAPQEETARPAELGLLQAIQIAMVSNPDLHSARERIEIADGLLASARAEFYPKLSLGESFGVTNNPANAFMFLLNQARFSLSRNFNHPGFIDNFQTQALFQYNLYAGGSRKAKVEGAGAQRQAEAYALEAVQNELVFRVAEAYYRLLQADQLVAVRAEAVEQVRHHLEIVQTRFKAGSAVKSDVLTVQVRLAEVKEKLITAQNQLKLSWAVLENVTGAELPPLKLPGTVPVAPWSKHVDAVETAVAEAVRLRPELGELNSRRLAAESAVKAARAGKRPAIDLLTDYSVYTPNFSQGNDSFFVGLAARLNIFDGGRTRSNVRQAEARVRELAARQKRQMLDVELDVRRTYLQLSDAQSRFNVVSQVIDQAEQSLREIEVRYRGQTATITQLIDAQVALSNARVRRANTQADVEIARASLERAVGRMTNLLQFPARD